MSPESLEGSSERPLQAAAVLWPGSGSRQPGLQAAGQSVLSLVTHRLCDFRLYQVAQLSCYRPTLDPGAWGMPSHHLTGSLLCLAAGAAELEVQGGAVRMPRPMGKEAMVLSGRGRRTRGGWQ